MEEPESGTGQTDVTLNCVMWGKTSPDEAWRAVVLKMLVFQVLEVFIFVERRNGEFPSLI